VKLIVKGKLFTGKGILEGSVLIEDERITKITKEIQQPADQVLDFNKKGYIVLPGLIDPHVHMRDFKQSYKEDFHTGTGAAAMGGFTAVADMPNTEPRTNRPTVLKKRERVAKRKALVDYGLYYGVPDREGDIVDEIGDLAVGFKVFMQHEFYTIERELTEKALEFASRKKILVVAHAEDPRFFVETWMGLTGTPEAEASAIKDMAGLALSYGFPLHITHISSAEGASEFLRWKRRTKITADTCPHYLLLNEKDAWLRGAIAKVHPPIKSKADAKVLLKKLKDGSIDAVSSDHAPHSPEEKASFESAPAGFPGLETTLPLLLTMVNKGSLGIEDVVRACATNPSKILGLNLTGMIEKGKIGNLTVIDLHRRAKIDSKSFMSKAKYSPFEGRRVEGVPVATIVRGKPVMLDGEIVARKGWGKNVKTYG
jgi:dihydroorotase